VLIEAALPAPPKDEESGSTQLKKAFDQFGPPPGTDE
jgi:hypothetical protein